ncbi:MAG TPA: hypothetical protein VFI69_08445 [Candidatus Limnocylindrales bacterium]|nr:hypothetical protein [Candidatus Limnocylindrales bacterium]
MSERSIVYRQGDVLIRAVDRIPPQARRIEREGGRIVLAHGELTGHAHAITAPEEEATFLSADERGRFLQLVADVDVTHEEHAPIRLPAGRYEIVLQREWTEADDDRHERERWRFD